jgi:protein-tyrosine phosphatase
MDDDTQILFDSDNVITEKIYDFIEEAHQQGESCLVHSVRAQGRAAVALAVYFMRKYKWSLYKTLEFLNS